jgi:hypothetical protein
VNNRRPSSSYFSLTNQKQGGYRKRGRQSFFAYWGKKQYPKVISEKKIQRYRQIKEKGIASVMIFFWCVLCVVPTKNPFDGVNNTKEQY